jgi:hypothetical protein
MFYQQRRVGATSKRKDGARHGEGGYAAHVAEGGAGKIAGELFGRKVRASPESATR